MLCSSEFQIQKKNETKLREPQIRFQGNYTPVAMTTEKISDLKRVHLNAKIIV